MMGRRIVWFQLDRALVLAKRSREIDFIEEQYLTERGVGFGQIRIQAESFARRLFRFRKNVTLARPGVKRKQDVGVGQTSIGQRIIWIARDRLLIEGDRFRDVVPRTPLPKRPAFVIKLICGRIVRRLRRHHLLLWAGQLRLQCIGNRLRDLAFDREDVDQFPIISLRPEMGVGQGINELHIYAHLIVGFLDAPF